MTDTAPPQIAIAAAIEAAQRSPCQKSKRGAAIFYRMWNKTSVASVGWNTPIGKLCTNDDTCRALCARTCAHAEQMALLGYTERPAPCSVELVHVKLDLTVPHPPRVAVSGGPSCLECSKLLSLSPHHVAAVWLFHESGWRRYSTDMFHRLTLEHVLKTSRKI